MIQQKSACIERVRLAKSQSLLYLASKCVEDTFFYSFFFRVAAAEIKIKQRSLI